MSDVNNLPLPIGSSIVSNLNRLGNKGVRGGRALPNMYINTAFLFFSHKFTQFYLTCLIVPGFHCADYTDSLTLLPTDRAFFSPRVSFFWSACATVRLEVPEQSPETAVWPSHPFSLCLARSVWYFLHFLVFFPMVATSGGWCGTKPNLF